MCLTGSTAYRRESQRHSAARTCKSNSEVGPILKILWKLLRWQSCANFPLSILPGNLPSIPRMRGIKFLSSGIACTCTMVIHGHNYHVSSTALQLSHFSQLGQIGAPSHTKVAPMMAFFNRILDIEDCSVVTAKKILQASQKQSSTSPGRVHASFSLLTYS